MGRNLSVQCIYVHRSRTRIAVLTGSQSSPADPEDITEEQAEDEEDRLSPEPTRSPTSLEHPDNIRVTPRPNQDMRNDYDEAVSEPRSQNMRQAGSSDGSETTGEKNHGFEIQQGNGLPNTMGTVSPVASRAMHSSISETTPELVPAILSQTDVDISPARLYGTYQMMTPTASTQLQSKDMSFPTDSSGITMALDRDDISPIHEFGIVDWMTFDSALDNITDHLMRDSTFMPIIPDMSLNNVQDSDFRRLPPLNEHEEQQFPRSYNDCNANQRTYGGLPYDHPQQTSQFSGDHGVQQIISDGGQRQNANTHSWPTDWEPSKLDNLTSFPDMRHIPMDVIDAEDFAHVNQLSQDAYDGIVHFVERTSNNGTHYIPFKNSALPPLKVLNCFIQLYFEYFHSVFPMLHQATFNPEHVPRLLLLATAAIGCRYSKIEQSSRCADALQELLRRAIAYTCEQDNSQARQLSMAQTIVLNSIGMMYSGDRRLFEIAEASRNTPVTLCRRNGSLQSSVGQPSIGPTTQGMLLEHKWQQWAHDESLRRLGFCVFLLDAHAAMYLNLHANMAVTELRQSLPCPDEIWDSPSAETWKVAYMRRYWERTDYGDTQGAVQQMSLGVTAALSQLRLGKPMAQELGHFSRVILVFALYRSVAAHQQQIADPFAGQKIQGDQASLSLISTAVRALESLRLFSFSPGPLQFSLDCHIDLAIVLLNIPQEQMLDYTRSFRMNQCQSHDLQQLQNWVAQDGGRNARVAAVHAAKLCSLLRLNPHPHSFSSPLMALLATLALWTYNNLSLDGENDNEARVSPQMRLRVARLDKNGNDSVTQAWINNEPAIRTHITEVGPIPCATSSLRLLDLGSKILASMDSWALSQGLASWLERLKQCVSDTDSSSSRGARYAKVHQ
ncbi:fungal-specific transcription factor domain-containing protein [Talaromyces proteolyticus]|uniref:Fungal-specific transcription factor domain-containing protein n=1 Tax=Talaromyces proteolyticus TaxID=1131652 RepID=A0AAD4KGM8_9EURO|nr:fungal-specific transcription factor domain-containing protein [Talaromyces proteolyticus]KAH8691285.1 fungal-specific transcription factor domain-containing protein [Talaromyces proteolyticus]